MIELPACNFSNVGRAVTLHIPEFAADALSLLLTKRNVEASGQLYVKLAAPKRPRTTGWRSQNTHIHGHAQQIAEYTGDYKEDVISEAKRRAVSLGYPTRENSFGDIVPESEREASTVEAGLLIEELHHIASDMGIALKEYGDG